MRVLTLVGARPQFVKAAMLSKAFEKSGIQEVLVHSGQHYDRRISQIFFEELQIPKPSINLGIGSGTHAEQTGKIMTQLEAFSDSIDSFACVVVYGDTNTTLAGALFAAPRDIPLVHIEAGLRSFNMSMPEEINRIITDKLSDLLFCPTQSAVNNLAMEGQRKGVYLSGDVMHDATMHFVKVAMKKKDSYNHNVYSQGKYYLTTIHRPSNTDKAGKLEKILYTLNGLDYPVMFPLHPRTKERIKKANLKIPERIRILPPASYLQMLLLIQNAEAIITDSGGVQKEAFWLKKPCITLREETEWTETLQNGWNKLVGSDLWKIKEFLGHPPNPNVPQSSFGKSKIGTTASEFIAQTLRKIL